MKKTLHIQCCYCNQIIPHPVEVKDKTSPNIILEAIECSHCGKFVEIELPEHYATQQSVMRGGVDTNSIDLADLESTVFSSKSAM